MSGYRETFVYKTVAGTEIRADVYAAADPPASSAPVLLYLHGGALIGGTRTGINPAQLERYLAAGFTLVSADYRLAPETKLPAIIDDLRDAASWIRERGPGLFGVDPDRLGVVGHSAGGYLTLMSGLVVEPRPRALVAFYGYGDLVGEWYSKPDPFYSRQPAVSAERARAVVGSGVPSEGLDGSRGEFYLYCRQRGIWPQEIGGRDPAADPDFFTPYCPDRNVHAGWPPTLLLHGDADTDVPHALSVRMAGALADAGVEHELITVPSGPHGFDGRMDLPEIARVFERALDFLKRRLAA